MDFGVKQTVSHAWDRAEIMNRERSLPAAYGFTLRRTMLRMVRELSLTD
jgi:hypothetical protein